MPKTQNMVLGTSLFNTRDYKVLIKAQVEHPGKGVAPPHTHFGLLTIEKGPSVYSWQKSPTLLLLTL